MNSGIEHFERMAAWSRTMLAAAQAGDWDTVSELERHSAQLVQTLSIGTAPAPRDASERDHLTQLIRSILDTDAQIRALAEPKLAELGRLIGAEKQRERITRAYG